MSQVTYVELVDLYEQNYQYNCAQAAIIAVLMYEYAITLRDEVSLVWRSKATSTVIFYLNRLVMIGLVVAYMLDMFTWTTDVGCRSVSLLYIALELVTYAEWAVLSALRVYVVNTSSWVATAATLAFALVPVAYNIFASTQLTFTAIQVIPGLAVCDEVAKYSVSTARKGVLTARVFAITSELVVISVTIWKTYDRALGFSHQGLGSSQTLVGVLLRDGTIYFIVLLCINLLQLIMDYVAKIDLGALFIVPAMSILISRFLLDIRETGLRGKTDTKFTTGTSTGDSEHWQSVLFTTRIGFCTRRTELESGRRGRSSQNAASEAKVR